MDRAKWGKYYIPHAMLLVSELFLGERWPTLLKLEGGGPTLI